MSNLEIRVEPVEGVAKGAVVHLDGVLDQPTLGSFLSKLEEVHGDGKVFVILDMEGVSYANSTALGALVTQADAFRDAGGEMVLLKPQPKVDVVIDMLGLSSLFKVFASDEEARHHLESGLSGAEAPAEPVREAPAAPKTPAASFPLRGECVGCGIVLEFRQSGHFRCPNCHAVYSVNAAGRIAGSKAHGGQAIEVTLPCQPQSMKAFQAFIGALPAWEGYGDDERTRLEGAIAEVCGAICQKAYDGDETATFHALVVARPDGITLRLADHGLPLDAGDFPLASDYVSEFEHRPHPTRGNLIKMTKHAT